MNNYRIWNWDYYVYAEIEDEVEMSTGRRDCDGREIYVGDIVTLWLANYPFASGLFEIQFHDGEYVLYAHVVDGLAGHQFPSGKEMTGYDLKEGEPIWTEKIIRRIKSIGDFGDGVMEVLGNINEHPDLLNVSKTP